MLGVGVLWEIEPLGRCGGKAVVRLCGIPLNRRAAAGPVEARAPSAALVVRKTCQVAHSDLVAVIDRGDRLPGQQERECSSEVLSGSRGGRNPGVVVVGGWD